MRNLTIPHNDRPIVVFDIEVNEHGLMVGFKEYGADEVFIKKNPDRKWVARFMQKYFLIGQNSSRYDLPLLREYVAGAMPLAVNDAIISGERFYKAVTDNTLDLMHLYQGWHPKGLKSWESSLGLPIIEQDWEVARKVPLDDLVDYLKHDVNTTERVLNIMIDEGEVSGYLKYAEYVEEKTGVFFLGSRNQLTKFLLELGPYQKGYKHSNLRDYLKDIPLKHPMPLMDLYIDRRAENDAVQADASVLFSKKRTARSAQFWTDKYPWTQAARKLGLAIVSDGGFHYTHPTRKYFRKLWAWDVASLYPSVIEHIKIFGDNTPLYSEIKSTRVAAKKTDKLLASALKLPLNSGYGIVRSEMAGGNLYTPDGADICVVGNILFYELLHRFWDVGAVVAQSNTDAIYVDAETISQEDAQAIVDEVSANFRLTLEPFVLEEFYQESINQYFCLADGKLKAKGSFKEGYLPSLYAVDLMIMQHFLGDKVRKIEQEDYLYRTKAIGKSAYYLMNAEERHKISEKTGKELKATEIIADTDTKEYVGKLVRGYILKDYEGKSIMKYDAEKDKVFKVPRIPVGSLIPDEMFTDDHTIDYSYYSQLAVERIEELEGGI